ncbi:hypothetical protein D3C78_1264230 [compost metagenome]
MAIRIAALTQCLARQGADHWRALSNAAPAWPVDTPRRCWLRSRAGPAPYPDDHPAAALRVAHSRPRSGAISHPASVLVPPQKAYRQTAGPPKAASLRPPPPPVFHAGYECHRPGLRRPREDSIRKVATALQTQSGAPHGRYDETAARHIAIRAEQCFD